MSEDEVKKEINQCIYKYQKKDINKKLISILGRDFGKYRENFDKTQNYLKYKFIPDFPITVYVEPFNRCNLNCIMCYKKHHLQPQTELSLEVIKKIIEECKENKLPALMLSLGSEILLYKHVKELLDMVGAANFLDVFFGSNGVLMNEDVVASIIKNKITRVEISLDAATSETYKKVRVGSPGLDYVEKNINKLIEYKKKNKSFLPVIRLCYVIMDINKHETQQFINKWKDKIDYIDFQRFYDVSYIDSVDKIKFENVEYLFCSYPFNSLSVWADGMVTPCCHFLGKRMPLGNIYENSLKEIWEGEKIKKIQLQIANKKLNSVCQKCVYYQDKYMIDKKFEKAEKN